MYGVVLAKADRVELERMVEGLRSRLGSARFDAELAQGEAMTLEEAVVEALS